MTATDSQPLCGLHLYRHGYRCVAGPLAPQTLPPYRRPWRYGTTWDLELDSLADRLICNIDLRAAVAGLPVTSAYLPTFKARVKKLTESTGLSYDDQLHAIIERAIDHVNHQKETS